MNPKTIMLSERIQTQKVTYDSINIRHPEWANLWPNGWWGSESDGLWTQVSVGGDEKIWELDGGDDYTTL